MDTVALLELVLHVARDVESLLQKSGALNALEKHPVVAELEKVLNELNPPAPTDVSNTPTPTV